MEKAGLTYAERLPPATANMGSGDPSNGLRRDRSHLSLHSRPRTKNRFHDVAEVLLGGQGLDGFGRKGHQRLEVRREFAEEPDARLRFEMVAPDECLEREAGFVGRDALAEAGFEVGKLAEGVELAREELIEVGLGVFGDVHDDGICREIAEAGYEGFQLA